MGGICFPALLRGPGAIVLGCQLAACAMLPREEVSITVGAGQAQTEMAKNYASLYLPYGMMATAAYSDRNVLNSQNCPDIAKLGNRSLSKDDADFGFHQKVRDWVVDLNADNWECRFGMVGALRCPPSLPQCNPTSGLEFHVWRRMDKGCREVVIAFRGTDRNDLGDWQSNFRWLRRLEPKFDEYDQVRTHMQQIIERIESEGCRGPNVTVATTGHSLGGGLAQQAAYANPRVRYVYAFDPSPVTGFFDVSALQRDENIVGLGIDRAYEEGEILSLPRHIIEDQFLPPACNPRIRHIRFNLFTGGPLAQHRMDELVEDMRLSAHEPGADPRLAAGYVAARECRRLVATNS
jgi:dienelactone hydrolase